MQQAARRLQELSALLSIAGKSLRSKSVDELQGAAQVIANARLQKFCGLPPSALLPSQVNITKGRPTGIGSGLLNRMLEQVTSLLQPLTPKIVESTLDLAIEIAREGREGRRIGTLFTLGSADAVLERSRPLILDPLAGHAESVRHVSDPNFRGTVKELAQLDGAFVISDAGVFVAACRYLDSRALGLTLPQGLGARHMAAAAISKATSAAAIVVSQTATVRVFKTGKLVAEVLRELWLLGRYSSHLPGPVRTGQVSDLAVLVRDKAGS